MRRGQKCSAGERPAPCTALLLSDTQSHRGFRFTYSREHQLRAQPRVTTHLLGAKGRTPRLLRLGERWPARALARLSVWTRTGTVAVLSLASEAGALRQPQPAVRSSGLAAQRCRRLLLPPSTCLADYRFDVLATHRAGYCLGDQGQLRDDAVLTADEQADVAWRVRPAVPRSPPSRNRQRAPATCSQRNDQQEGDPRKHGRSRRQVVCSSRSSWLLAATGRYTIAAATGCAIARRRRWRLRADAAPSAPTEAPPSLSPADARARRRSRAWPRS